MALWAVGLATAIILVVAVKSASSRRAGAGRAVAANSASPRRPSGIRPSPASRPSTATVALATAPSGNAVAATSRSRVGLATPGPAGRASAAPGGAAAPQVLRVKLEVRPNSVTIERGGSTFLLAPEHRLVVHDILTTAPGAHVALRLPKGQWLALSGRLRLLDGPTDGDPTDKISDRVIVGLLSGEVRAKATAEGNGVVVRAGARSCRGEAGEFRVRHTSRGLRVEALSSYVVVRGPHATRTVPEGSGIILGEEPGFAHALLPAPRALRPVAHTAPAAPLLAWERVTGATGYRVILGSDPLFWIPEETAVVTATTYRPRVAPGKHFWMVVAQRGDLQGTPSKVYAFVVSPGDSR
jgi:hypothetical protein